MQSSSYVDPMAFENLNINSILDIGIKGTFKPQKQEIKKTECQKYTKVDTEKIDKVVCPYENEEGNLPINCKYIEQCKVKQLENKDENMTYGSTNNKSEKVEEITQKDKAKRGRPRKK